MRTKGGAGAAIIWGAGALLVAFSMFAFIMSYESYNDFVSVSESVSSYINESLNISETISFSETTSGSEGQIDYISIVNTTCMPSGTCAEKTYVLSTDPISGLVWLMVGAILLVFGLISFYLAHM